MILSSSYIANKFLVYFSHLWCWLRMLALSIPSDYIFWLKYDFAYQYDNAFFCLSVMWHGGQPLIGPLCIPALRAYLSRLPRACSFTVFRNGHSYAGKASLSCFSLPNQRMLAFLNMFRYSIKNAFPRRNMCIRPVSHPSCDLHAPHIPISSPTTIQPLHNDPPCFPMACPFTN